MSTGKVSANEHSPQPPQPPPPLLEGATMDGPNGGTDPELPETGRPSTLTVRPHQPAGTTREDAAKRLNSPLTNWSRSNESTSVMEEQLKFVQGLPYVAKHFANDIDSILASIKMDEIGSESDDDNDDGETRKRARGGSITDHDDIISSLGGHSSGTAGNTLPTEQEDTRALQIVAAKRQVVALKRKAAAYKREKAAYIRESISHQRNKVVFKIWQYVFDMKWEVKKLSRTLNHGLNYHGPLPRKRPSAPPRDDDDDEDDDDDDDDRSYDSEAVAIHTKEAQKSMDIATLCAGRTNRDKYGYDVRQLVSFSDDESDQTMFDLDGSTHQAVQDFCQKCESVLNRAHVVTIDTTDSYERYKARLQTFEQLLRCGTDAEPTESLLAGADGQEMNIPSLGAGGINDYMLVYLRELGAVLYKANESKNNPCSDLSLPTVPKSSSMAPTPPKISADTSIGAVSPHFLFLFRDDDVIEIPMNVTLFQTERYNPEAFVRDARAAILRRLAAHVKIGLHFMGFGVDTRATGVVLNPTCVTVMQLRLMQVGTRNVHLELHETQVLHLLTRKTYDNWLERSQIDPLSVAPFTDMLYPKDKKSDLPAGLVVLAKLLTSTRDFLCGPPPFDPATNDTDMANEKAVVKLHSIMGWGSKATVFKCKEPENCVVKVAKHGDVKKLTSELAVLKDLMKDNKDFMPKSKVIETVSFVLGGVTLSLPGLVLEPCAISCELALVQGLTDPVTIGEQLKAGLSHIHQCGYVHNYMCPWMVMFDPKTATAFVVGFDGARKMDAVRRGVHGVMEYIHRQIFAFGQTLEWTGLPEYDHASLALTMATIVSRGSRPWAHLSRSRWTGLPINFKDADALNEWAEERRQSAERALKEAGFTLEWMEWCEKGSECIPPTELN